MIFQSGSFTNDWINLVVLIRTAKKTKRVKNIIRLKNRGGISISPKATINKSNEKCIKARIKDDIIILIKIYI